ncbi:MFS transporter [Enterococcus sp. BWB1-3]|uniref:MFS transporter n=1 Tax=unclassified Enterococcus TaxID=2608891 RepID=UPI0019205699|nr:MULTISPECIES: MFS transporter [unclassified Enterococcus]MBL1229121.1 MFS transporter [Enterococcus sp. BWB1-3]MCB5952501.1 MFS transporter [Enterococcus sp. BWT-B8]MCB5953458.1 MFS transporter [Enterococcus sp. CWB-B31]
MKNKYMPTAIGLYINYIIHGMGVLIIMQNKDALASQWNTNIEGVSSVVAMLGIGRLIAILISGRLSDKFGRKPFVYLGMFVYILFFAGILFSPSVPLAMIFGVVAGIANSCLDSGTYPALMESFPKTAGTANVLIKAAVQIGQFGLPFIIAFLGTSGLWFGWSFMVCIVLLVLNGLFLLKMPFPDEDTKAAEKAGEEVPTTNFKSKPKMQIEGVAFVIYGFISQATFYLISQYIALYGQEVALMTENAAKLLVSYYSTGSLVCVAVTAVVATKVRPVNLILPYTLASFISIGAMWLFPTPAVLKIGAVSVGFFAAGGVMQLGLTVMGEMFPAGKGTITGIFYTFGSIASFVIPVVSGKIASSNPRGIMLFDTIIAGIGFILAVVIFIRYRQVIDTTPEKTKGGLAGEAG